MIISSGAFLFLYGGFVSVGVVAVMLMVAYGAGRVNQRGTTLLAIVVCVAILLYYKYTAFILDNIPASVAPGRDGSDTPKAFCRGPLP